MTLDVDDVRSLTETEAPDGAKGIGMITGWLAVHLPTPDGFRAIVDALRDFAGRNRRTVEIAIGGDSLKVSGVSTTQQDLLIAAWLDRRRIAADGAE